MPFALNSSVARPSLSLTSSEITSRRLSARTRSPTVPTSQSPLTKPCWRIHLSSTNLVRYFGIDADDLARRDRFLDRARDAGDRAAGAGGHHDRIELAAALLHDLGAGAFLVRDRVTRVRVLIEDVRVRDDLLEPPRDADVAL